MIRAFDCRERASQIQFLAWRNCDFRFFHPLSEEAASNLPMIPPQLPIVSLKTLVFFCRRWEPQQPPRSIVLIKGDAQSQCVVELLSRSFHRPRRRKTKRDRQEERENNEKASLNCIGGKWIGFRSRAEF